MFNKKTVAFIELFIAALTWSSLFIFLKDLEKAGLDPANIISARMIITSIMIGFIALAMKLKFPAWKDVPLLMTPGILFFFGAILIASGEERQSPGITAFLGFFIPIVISLFLLEKLKVKLNHIGVISLIAAVAGLVLTGVGDEINFNIDILIIFLGACLAGVYFVSQKFLVKKHGPYVVTVFAMWGGVPFALFFMPSFFSQVPQMDGGNWIMMISLCVIATLIPFFMFTHAMREAGPAEGTAVNILIPFFGSLIAWVINGFPLSNLTVIGGLLSLVGVLFYITRGIENTEENSQ